MKLYKDICFAWISCTFVKTFSSQIDVTNVSKIQQIYCYFTESTSMGFWRVTYENVEKKHFITNISIYIWSQTICSFMKFYFVHIVKVCFVLKNSYYSYIPMYINKTLLTLGNKKEQQQIKFNEKLSGKLIFSRVTKNLKMFYFTATTRRVL